jgi:TRAP-type transport system periplasmic protein
MDRRSFVSLAVRSGASAAGAGMLLSGCGTAKTKAKAKAAPIPVRVADNVAATNPEIAAEQHFGQRLAALTDNRYAVTVYPDSALGDANHMNESLRAGTLEVDKCLVSYLSPYDKRLGLLSLPYIFGKQQELFDALDGKLGNAFATMLDAADIVVLGYFDSGARSVYNNKRAIRTPSDLKGLRIRVPQDVVALNAFNMLGAQATALATNDILSALQKGLIDGAENNIIFYMTNKHVDYAHYYSWTRHQFGADALMASKKWLTGLPKKDQELVRQAGHEAVMVERQLWKAQTDEYTATAAAAKVQLNDDVDVPAFQQAIKPLLTQYKGTFGDLMNLLPIS